MTHVTRARARHAVSRSALDRSAIGRPTWFVLAVALVGALGGPGAAGPATTPATIGGMAAGAAQAASSTVPATETATIAPAYDAGFAMHLVKVRTGLAQPVFATNAHDGTQRIYVVEKVGRIRVLSRTGGYLGTLLDIRTRVSNGGEQGLLGLAFHPSYGSNHKYYVNYTDRNGDTIITEYRSSSNGLRTVGGRVLIKIAQPYSNHNGGMLAFGRDGLLYIGMGDGGGAGDPGNRAQSVNSLLGKILRMNVNGRSGGRPYAIPSTNPYVGRTGLDLIWSRGLRNPWRFSFDRATGDLWIGDVGQARYEEIDRSIRTSSGAGRGANYGWRQLEGRHCYRPSSGCRTSGMTMPVVETTHRSGDCAIIGGYVYRGTAYPKMTGGYLFADLCSHRIYAIAANATSPAIARVKLTISGTPSSFGETEDGTMLLTTLTGGVYRITAS